MIGKLFKSDQDARETLENLLLVINDSVKKQDRMTPDDIRQLVRGGPAELQSDLAHTVGNLLITAVYLGEKITPSYVADDQRLTADGTDYLVP